MSGTSAAQLRADEVDYEFDLAYAHRYRDVFRYCLILLRDT